MTIVDILQYIYGHWITGFITNKAIRNCAFKLQNKHLRMAPSFDDGNALFEFVVREGNGVKGLIDSGLTKVPDRYIQSPKERINKLTAGSSQQ